MSVGPPGDTLPQQPINTGGPPPSKEGVAPNKPLEKPSLPPSLNELRGAINVLKNSLNQKFLEGYSLESSEHPDPEQELIQLIRDNAEQQKMPSEGKVKAYFTSSRKELRLAAQICKAATLDTPPAEAFKQAKSLLTRYSISNRQFTDLYNKLQTQFGIKLDTPVEEFEAGKELPERIESLLNELQTKEYLFSEESLAKSWSGFNGSESRAAQFLMAATLLHRKESITPKDALKRAEGRLAKHGSSKIPILRVFFFLVVPIIPFVIYKIWQHKKVKKWEGVQDVNLINQAARANKLFLERAFKEKDKSSIMLEKWNPGHFPEKDPRYLRGFLDQQLFFANKTITAFDPSPMVVSSGGKDVAKTKETVSQNKRILEGLRSFISPPQDSLQTAWYQPGWQNIKGEIGKEGGLNELKTSLNNEMQRLTAATDSRLFAEVRETHMDYIKALQEAVTKYEENPQLLEGLTDVTDNCFENFLTQAGIEIPKTYQEGDNDSLKSFRKDFKWGVEPPPPPPQEDEVGETASNEI